MFLQTAEKDISIEFATYHIMKGKKRKLYNPEEEHPFI